MPFVCILATAVNLMTYPFSDPDPVPATSEKRWPYFRYDGSAEKGEMRLWETVELENDRIKVSIVPAVGGKVWGAVDKKTGREFIYFNHSVKFRNIAMRGPWVSGGIEFNFGIVGHSPSTATPVDWCVRTNADASVSYFCSNTELINRTLWQVEVRLGRNDDFFTTRTLWHNAADLPGPYYQWMTAAYTAKGNPELVFPGTFQVGHEGDAHPWPVDEEGRDLSHYQANDFGHNKSYHVLGGDTRQFAIWWPDDGFGSYHRNDFGEKFGRKIWLWSLSREGGIWEDLLTDADGQYVELQSGRAFNQPRRSTWQTPFKHPTFAAGATDEFSEHWGVVRDRHEIVEAWNPTNYVARPSVAPTDFDWDTAYGRYVRGEQALRERDDCAAAEYLEKALAKEPCLMPALTTLAELEYKRGHYDVSRALCAKALGVNTYDPAANFFDGLCAYECGETLTALERFGLAAYSPMFRPAAYAEMSKIYIGNGNFNPAFAAACKCSDASAKNPEAFRLKILALRLAGRKDEAERLVAEALESWPLAHGVRYEAWKLKSLSETEFRGMLRNERPHETCLELGTWYETCGRYGEAKELFALSGSFMGSLRLAYLDGDKNALSRLSEDSVRFVFPFRREASKSLDWACLNHASWKFKYLRALLFAANGDGRIADHLLASVNDADDAVFFLYRASRRKDVAALRDLDVAAGLDDSWRVGRAKMSFFAENGEWKRVKEIGADYLKRFPRSNPLQILYAKALLELKDYEGCLAFLEGVKILPSEFGDHATGIWQSAQKALGCEITWPESLGAGRPYSKEEE